MAALDPDDARSPYVQVVAALRREIEQGTLQPGAKLPTQQQLASQFEVSIGTIKRAFGELQGAGLIVSRQGQGAFVRTRRSLIETGQGDSSPESRGARLTGSTEVVALMEQLDEMARRLDQLVDRVAALEAART